jgi:integrase/recombinase XerD
MQLEVNPSNNYAMLNNQVLSKLSRFHQNKDYADFTRNDIIVFLNSFRKSDKEDPMHKWIGTYNTYLVGITRFFKWLENPDLEPKKRPTPQIMKNISKLKRKETSIYKPSDLWSQDDDVIFLKYCPKERDRSYHAISRDMSARPHEILNLKIKDIVIKNAGNKQYAEVLVNGKTGTRHLPLIDSLPYIKQWLDRHPHRNNSEAYFICSLNHARFAQQMRLRSLQRMYERYKESYFPNLLQNPTVPKKDKQHIQGLLLKPWNPYIRRHSALTEKSKYLREHIETLK